MTMLNLLSATEIVEQIRKGMTTPSAVMEAHLNRIAERESEIGAFIFLDAERAMERAKVADKNPSPGLLYGLPFVIKDIIDTADMPTCWGSEIYQSRRPTRNAACVQAFLDAGAIPIGKSVTTEFAYFKPGKTRNPHNLHHTPGGSSSGSAAAVADYMAPLAFGSQTAASLIRPAAYCGICAFKPTKDVFDLAGVMSLAPSLDTLGVLARHPEDLILARSVLSGIPVPEGPDYSDQTPRLALMRGPHWQDGTMEMRDVCRRATLLLQEAGLEIGEIAHPPIFSKLTDAQKTIMAYEAARHRSVEYQSHRDQISPQFLQLVEQGLAIKDNDYQSALDLRDKAIAMIDLIFDDFDALIVASAPGEAPEGLNSTGDPLFSRMWTLLQLPAVALPLGRGPNGLPLGVQLIGRKGKDDDLLQIASWVNNIFANDAKIKS
jgi:Asp-tRNA(Asn)/Glu-tRNA(Gln) amidotransferase A subunit family amidase